MLLRIIEIYFIAINLWGFLVMGYDKGRARKNKRRVSERELFLTALAGGSIGIWLAMYAFRHKTQHKSFTIGIPCIFTAQAAIVLFCIYRGFTA